MRKGLRRKYHREMIHQMRRTNKQLREDPYIGGRFVVMENDEEWLLFSDKSGGILKAVIRVYDQKYDEFHDYTIEYNSYIDNCRLGWMFGMDIVNDFACHQVLAHKDKLNEKNVFYPKVDVDKINKRRTIYEYNR